MLVQALLQMSLHERHANSEQALGIVPQPSQAAAAAACKGARLRQDCYFAGFKCYLLEQIAGSCTRGKIQTGSTTPGITLPQS